MKFPELELPKKPWVRIVAVVAAVAVLAGAALTGYRMFTGLPDDAAFEYDSDVVTKDELAERADVLTALYGIKQPTGGDEQEQFHRDIAKAVAVSMILDHAAEERDIVISDKSARDTLAKMVKSQLANSEEGFTELLAEFGVSEDDVLDEVKRQQAIASLFREVTKSSQDKLSAGDVRAYFAEDPSRFATPERRHLRNIVVKTKRDAKAVVEALRRGNKFEEVARSVSLDDATRDKGGDLGTVAAAQLDAHFSKAAFATRAGKVFGPVKTTYGWNVGEVVEVKPSRQFRFAKVKDRAAQALRSERALDAWRDWLSDEIKDADVEYAADYRPDNPDEPPQDAGVQDGSMP